MRILECSSKGDKRFSSLFARVMVNNKIDTIENHYQLSKVFLNEDGSFYTASSWKDAKGKKPVAFKISGKILPLRFGKQYYNSLWYKYLKANKGLEEVLVQYDDYNDIFKGKDSFVCQADTIRAYMQDKNGIKYDKENRGLELYKSCVELFNLLKGSVNYIIEDEDIFKSYANILGHQVNCQGKMASGIAKSVAENYPKAYKEYMRLFMEDKSDINKLGKCQIVDCGHKMIANLFGQRYYGRNKNTVYTQYDKIEEALVTLKEFAKENNMVVALPFKIGCSLGNGDWDNKVLPRINRAFKDYYVVIYRYR